jgi:hypothetical protein
MSAVVPEKSVASQNTTSSRRPVAQEKMVAPEKSGLEKSNREKSAPEKSALVKPAGAQKPSGAAGYSVVRALGKCHICAADIAPGTKLMTALRETPESLVRMDVCLNCWANFDKTDLLGFWQLTMPQPSVRKKVFLDDEVLLELFERLTDAAEPAKINFRFVLGLILMRKRRLVYESTRTEGKDEIWILKVRGADRKIDLLNPKLNEQRIAEVSTQLGEILNEEL